VEPQKIRKRQVDVRATPKKSGITNQKSEMRRKNGSCGQRKLKKRRSDSVQQRKIQKGWIAGPVRCRGFLKLLASDDCTESETRFASARATAHGEGTAYDQSCQGQSHTM
jgi:hypothetical protein